MKNFKELLEANLKTTIMSRHLYSGMFLTLIQNCIEEFPTLSGEAPPPILGPPNRQNSRKVAVNNSGVTIRTVHQSQPLAVTDENFPALGPDNTAGGCKTVRLSVNSGTQDRPSNSSMRANSQKQPTNVSIHVNHRSSGSSQNIRIRPASSVPSQFHDDFPSLSSSKAPVPSSVQWLGSQGSSGTKSKVQVPSSVSQPPKAFKKEEDFPSLSSKFNTGCSVAGATTSNAKGDGKSKKASSVMIPVTSSWSASQDTSRTHESNSEVVVSGKSSDEVLTNTTSSLGNIKVKSKKKKTKSATSHNSANDTTLTSKPTAKDSNSGDSGKKKKKQGNTECENHPKSQQNKENGIEDRENKKPKDNTPTQERKRSELLIASLTNEHTTENNNNNNKKENSSNSSSWFEEMYPPFTKEILDDFPSLTNSGSLPPGFEMFKNRGKLSAPPPGFGGGGTTSTAPPPGFLVTLNSVARPQTNGLTFTNSSGESYSILPGRNNNSNHSFVPPHDFVRRNQTLVTRVKKETMGPKSFADIFAELLVLLPDIEKQQELWQVHTKDGKCSTQDFEVCATCRQVLSVGDLRHHVSNHSLENHFPALGSAESVSQAWGKK
ncbi:hypothetical protein L9F63_008749 [Diploptera punctata]|uniref:ZNF598 C2H2 zinc finger domain-containing protein n=1 Tax=Diploptera punctata TaxID=6984 RepID=A0AAD7Z4E3_DIPPU|nr:hypothetical protein L9F63_008749 [Diploptera punctata]